MAVPVVLHPHAEERATERGATTDEVIATVEHGESFPARLGRTGFRRNFPCGGLWRGGAMLINRSKHTQPRKMVVGS